jgi:small conductance mechanosensitive channel
MPSEIIDKYIKEHQPAGVLAKTLDKIEHYFIDGTWTDVAIPLAIKILLAFLIYFAGSWLVRKIIFVIDKVMQVRGFDLALRSFLEAVLSILLKFAVALVAIEQLGVNTSSLLALLGAAGLAVGLALKDSLSNFASGVLLILMKPFKAGDFIEAAGVSAMVDKITIFSTVLKTGDNREVIVPNSQIYGGTITNYSSQKNRRIDLVVSVSYEDDIKKVRNIISRIVAADDRILKDPETVIAVAELGENSVNFVVRPWVSSMDYWAVRWNLLETIKIEFAENGITIPYPQRSLHVVNVNQASD